MGASLRSELVKESGETGDAAPGLEEKRVTRVGNDCGIRETQTEQGNKRHRVRERGSTGRGQQLSAPRDHTRVDPFIYTPPSFFP